MIVTTASAEAGHGSKPTVSLLMLWRLDLPGELWRTELPPEIASLCLTVGQCE